MVFEAEKVVGWSDSIVESVLKGLTSANKPFKYIGTELHPHAAHLCVTQHILMGIFLFIPLQ